MKTDSELLQEFRNDRSEPAFQALVQRHVDLVYGTAFRKLGAEDVAREVTQNVFVALARRANSLRRENGIAGWLHRTTLLEARLWWRGEYRRRRREQFAAELGTTMNLDESLLKSLVGELDEGLMELRDLERQALLLRYFEKRSHREVGTLLGTSEDAARKRIDRALEQLTQFFRRRGYAVPATAATIAALEGASHAAPIGLAAIAGQAGLAVGGAASLTGLGLWLAKLMAISKTQAVAVSLVVAATPIAYQWHTLRSLHQEQAALIVQRAALQTSVREAEEKLERSRETLRALDDALAQTHLEARRKREMADSLRNNDDAHLYFWSDESEYVRVPKSLARELQLSENRTYTLPDGNIHSIQNPALANDGSLSTVLRQILDIKDTEESRWKEAFKTVKDDYRAFEQASTYVTNTAPKEFPVGDRSCMTIITPAWPEKGEAFQQQLHNALNSILGEERAEVVWKQGQSMFASQFNQFGGMEKYETVAIGEKSGLSYWKASRKPGEEHFSGGFLNTGGPVDARHVPEQFRNFVTEWKNKFGTNQ